MRSVRGLCLLALILAALSLSGGGGAGHVAGCAVDPATVTARGCELVASDIGRKPNPEALWGVVACEVRGRHRHRRRGGDTHLDATGAPQRGRGYRRLVIREGDDYYGQRCELGRNEHRFGESGGPGTFQLYHEGERRITFASYKLLPATPVKTLENYAVMQIKQAQPSDNGGYSPMLSLTIGGGKWIVRRQTSPGDGRLSSGEDLWRTPARRGVWTRLALDVTYSQFPDVGRLRLFIDRNGDGDARDRRERSPQFRIPTLKSETPDSGGEWLDDDGIAAGASIPGHLRVGLYQAEALNCSSRARKRCAIAIDGIQVVSPG